MTRIEAIFGEVSGNKLGMDSLDESYIAYIETQLSGLSAPDEVCAESGSPKSQKCNIVIRFTELTTRDSKDADIAGEMQD